MGSVLIAIVTGAVIGWIGSVVMQTDTQAGIFGDIGVGAFSGLVAAMALAPDYLLDSFLSAALGAMLVVGALSVLRRSQDLRSGR